MVCAEAVRGVSVGVRLRDSQSSDDPNDSACGVPSAPTHRPRRHRAREAGAAWLESGSTRCAAVPVPTAIGLRNGGVSRRGRCAMLNALPCGTSGAESASAEPKLVQGPSSLAANAGKTGWQSETKLDRPRTARNGRGRRVRHSVIADFDCSGLPVSGRRGCGLRAFKREMPECEYRRTRARPKGARSRALGPSRPSSQPLMMWVVWWRECSRTKLEGRLGPWT